MNTITATKELYYFYLEVTDPKSGETVRVEWDGLTLAEAKKMNKLTEKRYAVTSYVAAMERFGWELMR
jgi:uncharacterized protein (DUF427 family)